MDPSVIIVAVLSLVGTLVGSYLTGNKTLALIEYRLQQLEEKADKHNHVIERTYELEKTVALFDERIEEIEKEMRR